MSAIPSSNISQQYQKALRLQQSDPKAAFELYTDILKVNPRIAEVYFQIGRIHLARHAYRPALEALKRAEALKPNEAAIWSEIVNAAIGLADTQESKTIAQVLAKTKLDPKTKTRLRKQLTNKTVRTSLVVSAEEKALFEQAVSALNTGAPQDALDICAKAEVTYPKSATFTLVKATALQKLGRFDAAEQSFKAAIAKNPEYAEAYAHYGGFLYHTQRLAEAATTLEQARKLAPNLLIAQINMVQTLLDLSRFEEAASLSQQAVKAHPKDAEAAFVRGLVHERQSQHADALHWYETSESLGNLSASLYVHKGLALTELRRFDEAERILRHALDQNPKEAKAAFRLGSLFQTKGEFDQAEQFFLQAIDLDPARGEFYRSLMNSKKYAVTDSIVQDMKARFMDLTLPNSARRNIGFALAKVMEDNKLHDQVFTYLKPANDLMGEDYPYNIQERVDFMSEVKSAFEGFNLSARISKGYKEARPIFVTGMPRSGTTLVEQIIASHSKTEGAGEVGFVADAAIREIRKLQKVQKTADAIKPADLKALGKSVWDHLSSLRPGASHITDKSIQTYTMLPLLKAALPNARFIVVRRDPRDNLYSIYKNQFVDGTHTYAYDLKTLGTYYKLFDDLIAHWRTHFPDSFYEIHYEKLIENQEEEARSLIAAAGLEWEDACLEFYKNKRDVKTLSVYQVRQPIYKSSVKAWEQYKDELTPLFEALK